MSKLYSAFALDEDCTKKGVWVDLQDPDSGKVIASIRCRPGDGDLNPEFAKAAAEFLKRHKIIPSNEDGANTRRLAEMYADAVITEWQGIEDEEGNLLECTRANKIKVLIDLPIVFKALRESAMNNANYRREFVEDVVKNLPESSIES